MPTAYPIKESAVICGAFTKVTVGIRLPGHPLHSFYQQGFQPVEKRSRMVSDTHIVKVTRDIRSQLNIEYFGEQRGDP